MHTESVCSIQYYDDSVVNDMSSPRNKYAHSLYQPRKVDPSYFNKSSLKGLLIIHKKLQSRLREPLQHWRRETDHYIHSISFKMKHREISLKR